MVAASISRSATSTSLCTRSAFYSQRDISKVQVIQHLTREKGVTLAGVRHILSLFDVMKKHRVEPPAELREIFDRYAQLI